MATLINFLHCFYLFFKPLCKKISIRLKYLRQFLNKS